MSLCPSSWPPVVAAYCNCPNIVKPGPMPSTIIMTLIINPRPLIATINLLLSHPRPFPTTPNTTADT